MNKPNLLIQYSRRAMANSTLTMTVLSSAYAQSGDRIDQLERDVLALQQRLSKLETATRSSSPTPQLATSGTPWKSLSNWRQLKNGMVPNDVRAQLGEPSRVNGGTWATWFYPGDGSVNFYEDKVTGWKEPK